MFEGFQPKPLTVISRQGQKLQYCTIGKQILEVADGPEMQWHSCKLSKLLALFFLNIVTFLETHFGNHNYLTVSSIHPSLLAPKVLLDYLRPMITIHPTNPIPQSLFNHLNGPWIDLSRPPMTSNDLEWPQMTSNDLKWPIVLDDHWSKKIYRPKMIVWSSAINRP